MTYRNKRNGAIIETKSVITGTGWEPVITPTKTPRAKPEESKAKAKGNKSGG